MESAHVYKICSTFDWARAQREGELPAPSPDAEDGFVHLSTGAQVRETARLHFAGRRGLLLLTVGVSRLEPGRLRWEPARGGELFPHLYGKLRPVHVLRVDPLPLGPRGEHQFPRVVEAGA